MGGMASHHFLYANLLGAVRGLKVAPTGAVSGSLNYLHMSIAASAILDPSKERQAELLDLLQRQEKEGHLTRRGPKGVACEAGAPAAHWTFNVASVTGALLIDFKREQRKLPRFSSELREACIRWITNEVGLDRNFRWRGHVILPAPRVKDEKGEGPVDGYRDVFVALALGEAVQKPQKYYAQDLALAVACMKTLRDFLPPSIMARFRTAPVPKLHLPILRRELDGGGYEARIQDTPEARTALGRDACHFVHCGNDGVRWAYDWDDTKLVHREIDQ